MKKFNYLIGTHCKLTLKNLWTIIQHAPPIHGVFITKPKKKGKQAKKRFTKVVVTFIGLFSYLIVNISSQCTSVLVINLRRHKKSRKKCTERIKPCLLSKTKQVKEKKNEK